MNTSDLVTKIKHRISILIDENPHYAETRIRLETAAFLGAVVALESNLSKPMSRETINYASQDQKCGERKGPGPHSRGCESESHDTKESGTSSEPLTGGGARMETDRGAGA